MSECDAVSWCDHDRWCVAAVVIVCVVLVNYHRVMLTRVAQSVSQSVVCRRSMMCHAVVTNCTHTYRRVIESEPRCMRVIKKHQCVSVCGLRVLRAVQVRDKMR